MLSQCLTAWIWMRCRVTRHLLTRIQAVCIWHLGCIMNASQHSCFRSNVIEWDQTVKNVFSSFQFFKSYFVQQRADMLNPLPIKWIVVWEFSHLLQIFTVLQYCSKLVEMLSECQTAWFRMRPWVTPHLFWTQVVCILFICCDWWDQC